MKMKFLRMKAKPLFLAVGLAIAGLVASPLRIHGNVVGYANIAVTNGYNFLANPFQQVPSNSITNVIPSAPEGTTIYLWDVTNQEFTNVSTFLGAGIGWFGDSQLDPGVGFVMTSTNVWTNAFVGEVLEGDLSNAIAGPNKFSLVASMVPLNTNLVSLEFPGTNSADGNQVYLFDNLLQTYSDAYTHFEGLGWFDPNGVADTNGPVIPVGTSFFVQNPGPDWNWYRYFSASSSPPPSEAKAAPGASPPQIGRIAIRDGTVTLHIVNPSGGPYNVQFSTDRRAWSTVATDQTGATWTGALPGGPRGYYQVVQSLNQ